MTLKHLRCGRMASIVSGLVLGAYALFNPINVGATEDSLKIIDSAAPTPDVSGGVEYLKHQSGSIEGFDGGTYDSTWADPGYPEDFLKICTKVDGTELQWDSRPDNSETTFTNQLSAIDVSEDGIISSSNKLNFSFSVGPDLNRDYAAKIHCDGTYTPTGSNFDTNADINDVIANDGGFVYLPGITNLPSGTVYGTCKVGCAFYLDKIFLTNKASNAGSTGMRLIHLGGPEANDREDMHDSTRIPIPNPATNLWLGAYTSPFGTNLFKDVRTRDGTNSYSFAGKLFAVNNTGGNASFSNSLEAIVNYITESNRNYRLDVNLTNGNYRVNGQAFSTNQILTTNGVNVIPIGIVTNIPTGTNDYADFALKQIFQVISSNGNNGSISPAGTNWTACGDSFAITSSPNYHISLIQTNGGTAISNTNNNNLSSTNFSWPVNSTGTIYAAFDINKYSLNVNAPAFATNYLNPPGTNFVRDHGEPIDLSAKLIITNGAPAGTRYKLIGPGYVVGNDYTNPTNSP